MDDLRQSLLRHDERSREVDQRACRRLDDHHGALGRDSPRSGRLRNRPRHQPENQQPQNDVPALRCGPDGDDTLLHSAGQDTYRSGRDSAVHRPIVRSPAFGKGSGREGFTWHSPPRHNRLCWDSADCLARTG